MEEEQHIINHLTSTYHPAAILLHGSRAVGKHRPHSDWDIIMLFEGDIPRTGYREEIAGEDVEWKAYQLPINDKDIIDTFDVYLQFAKVLWEKDSIGTHLLQKTLIEYQKGPRLSEDEWRREKQFFTHKVFGMKDDKDTPYMFLRHVAIVFNRATNMWFEILHNEFGKPLYFAMPLIQERDGEYYARLMVLCSPIASSDEKITAAEYIKERLFGKKR